MDFNTLIGVSVIWAIAVITPGPNFFITVHTAVDSNSKRSLSTVAGIITGTFIWAVSGYLGISLLFKTVPVLYYSLKIIGGLYLLFVGLKLIVGKKQSVKRNQKNHHSSMDCFRLGLLTNLLNPKTAAFITSLFAATIPPHSTISLGVSCVIVICLISALWYFLVATLFSFDIAKRAYENHKRKIEKVAGTIFMGFGVKLAVSK